MKKTDAQEKIFLTKLIYSNFWTTAYVKWLLIIDLPTPVSLSFLNFAIMLQAY